AAVRPQAELEEEERQGIARVHEAASSINVEEWEDIQARVKTDEELAQRYFAAQRAEERRNKPPTKAQQRTYMSNYIKHMRSHTLQHEVDKAVPKLAARSSKRDAKEELDQESSKRQNTAKSSELAKEPKDKKEELLQEELQQMMIIVPEQRINVKALQTKYLIINCEIYTKGTRKYWKIIKIGNHTENFKSTDDKERVIWVKLKRLFKPDTDDELWKLQNHIHDFTWRLYDSCGVHYVSTEKGIDIYMLVEKEYPLSRGTLTLMLVAKLLVDQDNEMSRELLRKIFMQAERPRR
ncbi:hypothetical protein Tco_1205875, partial [Tanacetum coccineum]